MSNRSKIEWTDVTWNPVTGCTKISPGCKNCYAERMAKRLRGRAGYPNDDPFRVTLHGNKLEQPFHWRKPRKIFVCSMGDLFHPLVRLSYIRSILDKVVQLRYRHKFIFLTKRPQRMKEVIESVQRYYEKFYPKTKQLTIPFSNLWLGVTAENQEQADKRIPILLQIPATVRFVSIEPMLGPVNLKKLNIDIPSEIPSRRYKEVDCLDGYFQHDTPFVGPINWVISGGESGPGARPMHPDWARSLRDQCTKADVPFFFKGWGEFKEWDIHMPQEFNLKPEVYIGDTCLKRVGKKAAGRLLDGQIWDQMPK